MTSTWTDKTSLRTQRLAVEADAILDELGVPDGPAPVSTSDYGETHTVGPPPDGPGLVERAIKRVFG